MNKKLYLGTVYDDAIATFEKACARIKELINCDCPENFIEAKIYRISQEVNINDTNSIVDAISSYSGYPIFLY